MIRPGSRRDSSPIAGKVAVIMRAGQQPALEIRDAQTQTVD